MILICAVFATWSPTIAFYGFRRNRASTFENSFLNANDSHLRYWMRMILIYVIECEWFSFTLLNANDSHSAQIFQVPDFQVLRSPAPKCKNEVLKRLLPAPASKCKTDASRYTRSCAKVQSQCNCWMAPIIQYQSELVKYFRPFASNFRQKNTPITRGVLKRYDWRCLCEVVSSLKPTSLTVNPLGRWVGSSPDGRY
jgi:hypothetical protein